MDKSKNIRQNGLATHVISRRNTSKVGLSRTPKADPVRKDQEQHDLQGTVSNLLLEKQSRYDQKVALSQKLNEIRMEKFVTERKNAVIVRHMKVVQEFPSHLGPCVKTPRGPPRASSHVNSSTAKSLKDEARKSSLPGTLLPLVVEPIREDEYSAKLAESEQRCTNMLDNQACALSRSYAEQKEKLANLMALNAVAIQRYIDEMTNVDRCSDTQYQGAGDVMSQFLSRHKEIMVELQNEISDNKEMLRQACEEHETLGNETMRLSVCEVQPLRCLE